MNQATRLAAQQVVMLSGGAGGIGFAIAQRLGAKGAHIALTDRDTELVQSKAQQLLEQGISARSWALDVTNAGQCQTVANEAIRHFGRLDILIHCAGITQVGPFMNTQIEVYRRVMEANFFGAVNLTQAALEALLQSRGQIMVLSSIAGFAPLVGRTGYCASKYALHGFFETLRCELKHRGVSITMVCPSFVATDFASKGLNADGEVIDFERSTTGKPIKPDEVAQAIERASQRRSKLVVLSGTGKLAYWVSRLAPGLYESLMLRRFQTELERE